MLRLEEEDDRSRSTPLGKPEHTHTLSIIRSNRGLFRFFHLKRNKSVRKFATIVVVGKRVVYFYTSDYYNTRPVMRHHQYRTRHPLMDSNRKSFSPLSPLCPFLLKKRQRERIFFFLLAFALNNNTMERKDCFSLLLAGSSTFFGGHFGPCPGGFLPITPRLDFPACPSTTYFYSSTRLFYSLLPTTFQMLLLYKSTTTAQDKKIYIYNYYSSIV